MNLKASNVFDLIIIGGGAAAFTAAIFAARRKLNVLVLAKEIGGQAALTSAIENYPGIVEPVDGITLIRRFRSQAEKFGARVNVEEVTNVRKSKEEFFVTTPQGEYRAVSVIAAFGLTPRDLGVPHENQFKGNGISYSTATEDSTLVIGKQVAVVGGGNSALEAALRAAHDAARVYLIHRRNEFRGEATLIERVTHEPRIVLRLNSTVFDVAGDDRLHSVTITDTADASHKEELSIDHLVVAIGFGVDARPIRSVVELTKREEIIVDEVGKTTVPGLFAAGDATMIRDKQLVISAGEGAKAALSAYQYLVAVKGLRPLGPDWTVKVRI